MGSQDGLLIVVEQDRLWLIPQQDISTGPRTSHRSDRIASDKIPGRSQLENFDSQLIAKATPESFHTDNFPAVGPWKTSATRPSIRSDIGNFHCLKMQW